MSNVIELKDYEKIIYEQLEDEETFLKFLEENQYKTLKLDFSHVKDNSRSNASALHHEEVFNYLEEISQIIADTDENLFEKSVHSVASQCFYYLRESFSYLDILQEANIGLLNGIESFGNKDTALFDNYKNFWVIRAIVLYLKRELESTKNSFLRYFKMEEEYLNHSHSSHEEREAQENTHEKKEEKEPTIEEIQDLLNEDFANKNFINDDENPGYYVESLRETMERIVENFDFFKTKNLLSPIEIEILNLYFGFDSDKRYSIYEIENKLDIKRDQGEKIFKKAIEKISTIKEKSYR